MEILEALFGLIEMFCVAPWATLALLVVLALVVVFCG